LSENESSWKFECLAISKFEFNNFEQKICNKNLNRIEDCLNELPGLK